MTLRPLSICTALTVCAVSTAAVRADTLDDVLKKMKDKFGAYKTIQYKNKSVSDMNMQGMSMKSDSDMTFQAQRMDGNKTKSRMESTTKSVTKMGDQPENKTEAKMIAVSDGVYTWTYSEAMGQKSATKTKNDPAMEFNALDPVTAMQKNYTLKLLPDETVNGKPCYVIEMVIKDPRVREMTGRTVQYFDKDTLIGIKAVTYDKDKKVMATMTTTDIKVDATIPPDQFVFKAPPGVTVEDKTQPEGKPKPSKME